jgi:tRNA(Ile)-lysidine synthase
MLDPQALDLLKGTKNLLAFSGGPDSTALFFLLRDAGIAFDIAHVNYRTRPGSDAEAEHARRLAERHSIRCFIRETEPPERNFEAQARRIRYDFFEELVRTGGYDALLTAHQLDDRLEWLLMQLGKGAGLPELLGMRTVERRTEYTLVRPLLGTEKSCLLAWLDDRGIPWFEDESNRDERFLRNRFRHRFASALLEAFAPGIARSFHYLDEDASELLHGLRTQTFGPVLLVRGFRTRRQIMYGIDQWLKRQGYGMRSGDKERILTENGLVIGRRFALGIGEGFAILTPYETAPMDRDFREKCRKMGIGKLVRPFLFSRPALFRSVEKALRERT